MSIKGRIHSLQSMGTLDGPGIRYVIFTQGCNLRCGCCHNPDTWDISAGTEYSAEELVAKAERYKNFFGEEGGITVSGGEPLLQTEFVTTLFKICHQRGINTCLDTSGSILNDKVELMLKHTDRVLLDIKYTNNDMYEKYVGCSLKKPLDFLTYLNTLGIPVVLRQVIIPTLNDNAENIEELNRIAKNFSCVEKIELLPFRKICKVKYDNMGIAFPFDIYPAADKESVAKLQSLI